MRLASIHKELAEERCIAVDADSAPHPRSGTGPQLDAMSACLTLRAALLEARCFTHAGQRSAPTQSCAVQLVAVSLCGHLCPAPRAQPGRRRFSCQPSTCQPHAMNACGWAGAAIDCGEKVGVLNQLQKSHKTVLKPY